MHFRILVSNVLTIQYVLRLGSLLARQVIKYLVFLIIVLPVTLLYVAHH